MHQHHADSIQHVIRYFQQESEVEALLLGGSIAHGFEVPASDIDIMILISDQRYAERLSQGRVHFFNQELCTYPGGYVDGKYLGMSFLAQVAEKGSEPARFAFQDAQVLFSRGEALEPLLQAITRYPIQGKADRMQRFYAQLEAWYWYTTEALKQENRYLLGVSVSKLVLFGCRLILAHNELLYPYHKWLLRVLANAKEKPPAVLESIERIYTESSGYNIQQFYELVKGFRDLGSRSTGWPAQFMLDSELNWQTGTMGIDDL